MRGKGKTFIVFLLSIFTATIISSCGVVQDTTQDTTNSLTLSFGIEGIYVSLLDENLNIVETKVTDATGIVKFDNVTTNKNISIVISPEAFVSPKSIFNDYLLEDILDDLKNKCFGYNLEQTPEICNNIDIPNIVNTALEEQKIDKNLILSIDDDIPSEEINSADSNNDGYIDINELFNLAVRKLDKNKDGKLQVKEIENNRDTSVGVILDVQPGFYDLSKFYNYNKEHRLIEINIENAPDNVVGIYVRNYWHVCIEDTGTYKCYAVVSKDKDGKSSVLIESYEYTSNSDADLIEIDEYTSDSDADLIEIDEYTSNSDAEGIKKYKFLSDITQSKITLDYSTFESEKAVSATNLLADINKHEYLDLYPYIKGENISIGDLSTYDTTAYVPDIEFPSNVLANYRSSYTYDNNWNISKWLLGKNIGTTIPSEINFADFRNDLLDIEFNPVDENTVEITGNSIGNLDELNIEIDLSGSEEDSNGNKVKVWITKDPAVLQSNNKINLDIDISKFIPEDIYNSYINGVTFTDERKGIYVYDYESINGYSDYISKMKDGIFNEDILFTKMASIYKSIYKYESSIQNQSINKDKKKQKRAIRRGFMHNPFYRH